MTATLLNPGVAHTAPQGKYRSNLALPKREFKPRRAHVKAMARVTSGHPTVTPQEYDFEVCKYQGFKYSQTCDRCGGSCGSFDCSGLQCHVMDVLGIGIGCCTSFVMASMCYDEGLFLPLDIARSTQSHWAVKGSNFGRGPEPGTRDGGHIVDGRGIVNGQAQTMEAMGRRWGCLIASWDGRGWNAAYRIPGINYTPSKRERDMVIQPGRKSKIAGEDAYVIVADDGSSIECYNGASLVNDQPVGTHRRWVPAPLGNRKIVGAVYRKGDAIDPHDGISCALSDGHTLHGHFS